MLYDVVLVSAVQQSESAICVHISPPSRVSLLPLPPRPTPLGHHRALSCAPCAIQQLPIATDFTQSTIHMLVLLSQFVLPAALAAPSLSTYPTLI